MTEIFVFGSNLAGRHGKGAALEARRRHGAILGQGEGLQGNSYAIPTKDAQLRSRPLHEIKWSVWNFLRFAAENPGFTFRVTQVGCGLAGYTPEQIAPFFKNPPSNVILPDEFKAVICPWTTKPLGSPHDRPPSYLAASAQPPTSNDDPLPWPDD